MKKLTTERSLTEVIKTFLSSPAGRAALVEANAGDPIDREAALAELKRLQKEVREVYLPAVVQCDTDREAIIASFREQNDQIAARHFELQALRARTVDAAERLERQVRTTCHAMVHDSGPVLTALTRCVQHLVLHQRYTVRLHRESARDLLASGLRSDDELSVSRAQNELVASLRSSERLIHLADAGAPLLATFNEAVAQVRALQLEAGDPRDAVHAILAQLPRRCLCDEPFHLPTLGTPPQAVA